jgi:hypothetical protein
MKRFIETKFILALQEASQRGIDADAQVLENGYGEFLKLLFSEGIAPANRAAYRYALINTRVELASLIGILEKKCGNLSSQSH